MEQDLFLAMGGMAWAFWIRKKIDQETGKEIEVHWDEYSPLLIAKPAPFQLDLEVRNDDVRRRLERMWESGKGEDDMEKERQVAAVRKLAKSPELEMAVDDDAMSVGGSDTSGLSDAGSESSDSGSFGENSIQDIRESDIWT